MSTLLTARDLSKAFASRTLFRGVGIQLEEGERLGVIGPNGTGKSTLLKILAGLEAEDEGEVTRRRGLRLAYVAQDDDFDPEATVLESVVARLGADAVGNRLDDETRAAIALSRLGFKDFDQQVGVLSGGWRKRLSIACALIHEPAVLLLDEPTNHLDLEGVLWLEKFAAKAEMAIVFITHDRVFLERVAQRIVELSPAYPGGTFEVQGNYTEFVRRKEAFLDAQAAAQSALANRVRRDTAWLQQGIQGRQTRNKTQVADSAERRRELAAIKGRNDAPSRTARIDFQATERKTRKLLDLEGVGKSLGGRRLIAGLDLTLSPGQRVGLLGANGSGKTTLQRMLSGDLEPDEGVIRRADGLRVVNFTQHRALDPDQTLHEALCPVGDRIEHAGRSVHVSAWAGRFLFEPTQLRTFVRNLSGGEQARVLIARLMLEPADVLLLDEPTNDLDIPSLEVLERSLLEFPGAIVLVTHDRFMLERVSTEFLALDGRGGVRRFHDYAECAGVVAQQLADSTRAEAAPARKAAVSSPAAAGPATAPAGAPRKLSYKLQRECDGMEAAIMEAEAEVERFNAEVGDPKVIADHRRHAEACAALGAVQQRVHALYERWAELEAMQGG